MVKCTFTLLARIVFMMQRMKDLLLHQGLALPSEFKINLKISRRHLTGYVKEMFLNMCPATDHVVDLWLWRSGCVIVLNCLQPAVFALL